MNTLRTSRVAAVIAIALAVVIGAQGLAVAVTPAETRADTGEVLGKAGFAYLGGLRKFTAAILWNRIDPVFHKYYGDSPLSEQDFSLPAMRMVTILDPQFEQAYYIASFQIASAGKVDEGVAIARNGLENNPNSGLMHANLAQLLYIQDKKANADEVIDLALKGIDPGISWATPDDEVDGLAFLKNILISMGREADTVGIDERIDAAQATPGYGQQDHDHDGDGVQDH